MAYFIDGVQYTKEEYDNKMVEVKAHVALINDYVSKVESGEITLADVPEEYYSEVDAIVNAPEPEEPITEEQALRARIAELEAQLASV